MAEQTISEQTLIEIANELGSDIINKGLTGLNIGRYIEPIELKAIIADYLYKKFEYTSEIDLISKKYNTKFQVVYCTSCGKHTTLSDVEYINTPPDEGWIKDNGKWLCRNCYEQENLLALPGDAFRKKQRRFTSDKEFRQTVYAMDNGTCVYCGEKLSFSEFEVDHIKPISLCGETNIDNCVTSCVRCNRSKRDRILEAINMELTYGRFVEHHDMEINHEQE